MVTMFSGASSLDVIKEMLLAGLARLPKLHKVRGLELMLG
jgi:hypothetical protein